MGIKRGVPLSEFQSRICPRVGRCLTHAAMLASGSWLRRKNPPGRGCRGAEATRGRVSCDRQLSPWSDAARAWLTYAQAGERDGHHIEVEGFASTLALTQVA